ncbi:MAG: hypothetical protein ACK5PC_14100, partial [Cyclobacteriaceae bacterium]
KTQKTKTKNKAISNRKKHTVTSSNCELTFGGQFAAKNSGQFARNFQVTVTYVDLLGSWSILLSAKLRIAIKNSDTINIYFFIELIF